MPESAVYCTIALLATVAILAVIKAGGLARTRDIEVRYQAQIDEDAMRAVLALADLYAAQGVSRPGTEALHWYELTTARRHESTGHDDHDRGTSAR